MIISPDHTIRVMQEADLDAVLEIERAVHLHPWVASHFVESLRSGHHAWVMLHGEKIVGYAVLMVVLDEAQLLNLSIDAPFQQQGLGHALLTYVIAEAAALQSRVMFLEVRAGNAVAIALYQKVWFAQINVRRGYYPAGSGREDAIVMRLAL